MYTYYNNVTPFFCPSWRYSRLTVARSKVEGLSDVTTVAVACGAFHSLAVTSSGRLFEWGLVHTEPDISTNEVLSIIRVAAHGCEHLTIQSRPFQRFGVSIPYLEHLNNGP